MPDPAETIKREQTEANSMALRVEADRLLREGAALVGRLVALVEVLEAEAEAEWREGDL
jgi:hypothetical protein